MKIPTDQQIAAQTEHIVRQIVPFVAFVVTLVQFTYWAGYTTGSAIHSTSDWLAQHWPTRPQPIPAPRITEKPQNIENAPQPPAVVRQPLTVSRALELRAQGLSQRAIATRLGISRSAVQRALARG